MNFDQFTIINCVECGNPEVIKFNIADYNAWRSGTLIQDAFPYLSPGQREMFKTAICPICWKNMFSFNDEEEE